MPEERAGPSRSRTLGAILLGAAAVLELSSLAGLIPDALGREPAVRQAFLGALVAALAIAARPDKRLDRLWPPGRARLALLAIVPVLAAALLPRLAAIVATMSGEDPTATSRSLLLRALAAALVGGASGGVAGLAVNALGATRTLLPALAAGAALGALAPTSLLTLAIGAVVAVLVPRGASPGPRTPVASPREALAGALAVATGAAGLLGATPLLARLLAVRGELAPTLTVVLAGLALGAALRCGTRPATIPAAVATLLALALLGGALALAPGHQDVLLVPLGLAALAVGFALERTLARGERTALLGLALAPLLGVGVERAAQSVAPRAWSPAARTWLAFPEKPFAADLVAPLERGELTLRSFAFSAEGFVAVIDSRAGNCRELRRNGSLVGSAAIDKGESEADVLTPVLASVLAQVCGQPGGHVACLGLADGIAAGTVGRVSGIADLFLVERDPALLAIRDDPGDLWNGAWREAAARLVPEDARAFLARATSPLDAILDLDGALPQARDLELARGRLGENALLVRLVRGAGFREEARAFVQVFPDAVAFHAPRHPEVAILVGGRASLDPRKLVFAGLPLADPALPPAMEDLASALARTRLPATELTGTFAAGAEGIRGAAIPADLTPTSGDLARLERMLATPGAPFHPGRLIRFADSAGKLGFANVSRAILEATRALAKGETAELCRAEGDAFFREGNDALALARWNHALDLDPRAIAPRLSLAARLLKRNDLAGAKKLLESALTFDPDRDQSARYLLGKIALAEKSFAEAREHFQAASGFADADRQVELAAQLEREQASLENLPSSPQVKPEDKDPKRLLREARLLLDETADHEGQYARYLADKKGLEPNPDQLATFKSRREDARALLELASRKAPGDAAIFRELGRARLTLGDGGGARDAFEISARLDPSDGRSLFALGDVLREQGEDERALEAYKQGLTRAPISSASAKIYLACADIHVKKGRIAEAVRLLEEAERLAEGNPIVPVNLASLYVKLGRKPDAIRAYHRYLDLVGEGGDPDLKRRVVAALAKLERN